MSDRPTHSGPDSRRHGGRGHGSGRRSRGGFERGLGRGDFPTGRKLGSEDLQLVLLALLAEQPAHGYDLIRQLKDRSGGFYAPSPGMIYPALTYLDETGHAAASRDGNRKCYTLTETGRIHLAARREQADGILHALARIGGRMADVRDAFAGVDDATGPEAGELHEARHAIRHALRRKRGCTAEESRRIAAILNRATAEILDQS
ncbi:PadR family transcriptional regulator [Komagataeibacter intermedius]|uniref:PadR family transcriptional regulator n=2 Tax=Komagataeibacter intermedius TaxID=66229 RepID=A0A0N0MG08_9PROT|nr:PadR family transcriptional regulator [Komagataeibacter intermedius]KPH88206.1 PadR family transcriptional regulator [Komagataeibacter intermedius AF2]MCF3635864.1 PadR family transcriptional regulator [Komagataeibacter intermedius]GAN86249.1 transcriptional regulator PadR [Komagataeibacter intermedius TF2]